MVKDPECPACFEVLDWLDRVVNKITRDVFQLYICHTEDCSDYGKIYNDRDGTLKSGDPSGCY